MVAVNKTFYPARTWMPPHPATVKGAFRVAVCVCCYKEATYTIASAFHFEEETLNPKLNTKI